MMELYELEKELMRMNRKSYKLYKKLRGTSTKYDYGIGVITKVQGDPHANPSIMEVKIPPKHHGIPKKLLNDPTCREPLSDYVTRHLYKLCKRFRRRCGSGNSCYIGIPKPGSRILLRSSVEVFNGDLIVRFFIGLPAIGRKILAIEAKRLLIDKVNTLIKELVSSLRNELEKLEKHVNLYKDQEYLREWISRKDYIAFIPNEAILPRESSISQRPLRNAVKFKSPKFMEIKVKLPSGKVVSGMAIPKGVIVITGGAYHGKTTLLNSIQDGIYNHVEGDGREYLVSLKNTVTIKAEDGRIVNHVDISNFIKTLPGGINTEDFTTLNASGSTSMAAAISEALELNVDTLLIDEDTSATNLLFKDDVMNKLTPEDPINPLSNLVKRVTASTNTSIVIISSASSTFLPLADKVIKISNYLPQDITNELRKYITRNINVSTNELKPIKKRVFYGIKNLKKVKTSGYKLRFSYTDGTTFELDLKSNPRIVEVGQVRLLALIIKELAKTNKPMLMKEVVRYVNDKLRNEGFRAFTKVVPPDLTIINGLDVVWAINRLYRALIKQVQF